LVSRELKENFWWSGPEGDAAYAHRVATGICRRLRLQSLGKWEERDDYTLIKAVVSDERYWQAHKIKPPRVTKAEIAAEVVRAERWAERILKRQWAAVEAVAAAILRSPDGQLGPEEIEAAVRSTARLSPVVASP
jgi:hypothetical protein